ncbi:NADH dehydrogenase [ubiquinone] 1 alpha subcomplex subunit 12 [Ciona intestinalis]
MSLIQRLRRQFVPFSEMMKHFRHNYETDGGYFHRVRGVLIQMCRMNEIKYGTHVGTDELGNKYYENNRYFVGRNRWVDYNKDTWKNKWDFNASQITPEWHRWIHYMTDDTPTAKPPTQRKFLLTHTRNLTGTKDCYVPYSTTKPKIEAWKPE